MTPFEVIKNIYEIGTAIYNLVKDVKANKAQCQRLLDRIEVILSTLKRFESRYTQASDVAGLEMLYKQLDECRAFMLGFTRDSWFVKILDVSTNKARFAELTTHLQETVLLLNLSVSVHTLIDQEQDKRDQTNDLEDIAAKQAIILELLKHLVRRQDDQHASINEAFAALRLQVGQLTPAAYSSPVQSVPVISILSTEPAPQMVRQLTPTIQPVISHSPVVLFPSVISLSPIQPAPVISIPPEKPSPQVPLYVKWLSLLKEKKFDEAQSYFKRHPNGAIDISQVDVDNHGALYYALIHGEHLLVYDLIINHNIDANVTAKGFNSPDKDINAAVEASCNRAPYTVDHWKIVIKNDILALIKKNFTDRTLTPAAFSELKKKYFHHEQLIQKAVNEFLTATLVPIYNLFLSGLDKEGINIDTFIDAFAVLDATDVGAFHYKAAMKTLVKKLKDFANTGVGDLAKINKEFKRSGSQAEEAYKEEFSKLKEEAQDELKTILQSNNAVNADPTQKQLIQVREKFSRLAIDKEYDSFVNEYFKKHLDVQLNDYLIKGDNKAAEKMRAKYELFGRVDFYNKRALPIIWLNLLKKGDFAGANAWYSENHLKEGFDINATDADGHNALYYALQYKNYLYAHTLTTLSGINLDLPEGIEPNGLLKDVLEKNSPADWAKLFTNHVYEQLTQLLPYRVNAKVYKDLLNEYGQTVAELAADQLIRNHVEANLGNAIKGTGGLSVATLRATCIALNQEPRFNNIYDAYCTANIMPILIYELNDYIDNGNGKLNEIKEKFKKAEVAQQFNELISAKKNSGRQELLAFIDDPMLMADERTKKQLQKLKNNFEYLGIMKEYQEIVNTKFKNFDALLKEHLKNYRYVDAAVLEPKYQLFGFEAAYNKMLEEAHLLNKVKAVDEQALIKKFGDLLYEKNPQPTDKVILDSAREWYIKHKSIDVFNNSVNQAFYSIHIFLKNSLEKKDHATVAVLKNKYIFFGLQDRFYEIYTAHNKNNFIRFITDALGRLDNKQIFSPEPEHAGGVFLMWIGVKSNNFDAKEILVADLKQIKQDLEEDPARFNECTTRAIEAIKKFDEAIQRNKGSDPTSRYEQGLHRILPQAQLMQIKAGVPDPITKDYTCLPK